jgi:hypothetical protein
MALVKHMVLIVVQQPCRSISVTEYACYAMPGDCVEVACNRAQTGVNS